MPIVGKTAYCSIASAKELPRVKVLSDSIREHAKTSNVHILLCEHPETVSRISSETGESFLSLREVLDDWRDMAFYYSLEEYKTALTPYLIENLFLKGYETVVYLAPDTELYGSMSGIEELLSDHDLILSPHITESYCEDPREPRVESANRSDRYTPGFIGVAQSDRSTRLVDCWKTAFRERCFFDMDCQSFVDRFWTDMAPSCVENCYILKDSEYNMTCWSPGEADMWKVDGQLLVNGGKLPVLNFSRIDHNLQEVSNFQNGCCAKKEGLLELIQMHCHKVSTSAWKSYANHDYSFSRYKDGQDISLLDRKKFLLLGASERKEIENPFSSPEEIKQIVIVNNQKNGKRASLALYHLKSATVRLAANIDVTVRWVRDQGIVTTLKHVIRVMLRTIKHRLG